MVYVYISAKSNPYVSSVLYKLSNTSIETCNFFTGNLQKSCHFDDPIDCSK